MCMCCRLTYSIQYSIGSKLMYYTSYECCSGYLQVASSPLTCQRKSCSVSLFWWFTVRLFLAFPCWLLTFHAIMNVRENSECYCWWRIISNPIHHSNELQLGLLWVQTNYRTLAKMFHLITHFITFILEIAYMHGCFVSKFMS